MRLLAGLPVEVRPVTRTGLPAPADDRDIWEWARQRGWVIITNDEDFYRFARTFGFPPKVVMLRTGNQSTRFLVELLAAHFADIKALHNTAEQEILELF